MTKTEAKVVSRILKTLGVTHNIEDHSGTCVIAAGLRTWNTPESVAVDLLWLKDRAR